MAKLRYPTSPDNIAQLSQLEPMKLSIDGRPVTAIMVVNHLLVIEKDGSMVNYQVTGKADIRFIDYLTEDESITITGSSTGEPKDDPRESSDVSTILTRRIPLPVGSPCTDVPNWVPYVMLQYGHRYDSLNVPTYNGRRVALCFGKRSPDVSQHSNLMDASERFDGYIDCMNLDRWRANTRIEQLRVVPFDQWPEA